MVVPLKLKLQSRFFPDDPWRDTDWPPTEDHKFAAELLWMAQNGYEWMFEHRLVVAR